MESIFAFSCYRVKYSKAWHAKQQSPSLELLRVHYGQATARTPSCSTSRTGSRAGSRGKAIQSPQHTDDSDAQSDSRDEDPDFEVLRMS